MAEPPTAPEPRPPERLKPIEPAVPNLFRPGAGATAAGDAVALPGGVIRSESEAMVGRRTRHGVRISLDPAELRCEPGSSVTATVTVANTGSQADEFRIAVAGAAASFAVVDPTIVQVYPDSERTARIRFQPERGSRTAAGWAQYTVHADSTRHANVAGTAHGTVDVAPYTLVGAYLTPESTRGRTDGYTALTVANDGNTTTRVQASFTDRSGLLRFDPANPVATLYPGDAVDIPVTVGGPRRILGRTTPHPFRAVVTAPGQRQPVRVNGVREQAPYVQWWVVLALALTAALVLAVLTLPDNPTTAPSIGTGQTASTPSAAASGPTVPTSPAATVVPQLWGKTEAEATAQLGGLGVGWEIAKEFDNGVEAGKVIRTDPDAGQSIAPGVRLTLFISRGPRPDLQMAALANNCELLEPDESGQHTLALDFEMAVAGTTSADTEVRVQAGFGHEDVVIPAKSGTYQAFLHVPDSAFGGDPFLAVDVIIDPGDKLDEPDEGNNSASIFIDVSQPPVPGPIDCGQGGT